MVSKYFCGILGFLFFCFVSCKDRNENFKVAKASITPKEAVGNFVDLGLGQVEVSDSYYEVIDSIYIIPLETNDSILIGSISAVLQYGDTLIVVDGQKAQTILAFDLDGNFLYKIGSRGKGRGEYGSINDVKLIDSLIYVSDWSKRSLLCFSVFGKFISEVKFSKSFPETMLPMDSCYLGTYAGYFNNNPYQLAWISRDSIIASCFSFTNSRKLPAGTLLRTLDDNILFYRPLCDTIYRVQGFDVLPIMSLGLYRQGEVEAFINDTKRMSNKEFVTNLYNPNNDEITSFYKMVEAESYWFIEHQKGAFVYISFVDKKTNKVSSYIRTDMKRKSLKFPFIVNAAHGDCLLTYIDGSFFQFVDGEVKKDLYEHLFNSSDVDVIETYDFEIKNPIICKLHLKQQREVK